MSQQGSILHSVVVVDDIVNNVDTLDYVSQQGSPLHSDVVVDDIVTNVVTLDSL